MNRTIVLLIRGLPGVGKTTLGRMLAPDACFAADDYFEREDGSYDYDPEALPEAHAKCRENMVNAIRNRCPIVCVCNTFSRRWEWQRYADAVEGVEVRTVDLFDGGLDDATLAARCKHGVPVETIAKMRARWER